MKRYAVDDILVPVVLSLLVAILVWIGVMGIALAKARAECLKQGYPHTAVTWQFDAYCIGLDGQTRTEVKPLKEGAVK